MSVFLIKLAVVAVVAGNLIAFAIAIRAHFAQPEGMTAGTRVLMIGGAVFGLALVVVHALAASWVLWRVVVGLALCAVSAWLFAVALRANREKPLSIAGSADAPEHLNERGPYARIRHPFYAAYLATWLGAGIIAPHPAALLPAVVMGALYWRHAWAEEAKFLAGPLAEEYRAYRRRAGMFAPRFARSEALSDASAEG